MEKQNERNICSTEWFIRTYANREQIERVLDRNDTIFYRAILHDRDNCEPHYHILIKFDNRKKQSTVRNMLKVKDEKGEEVNSEIEIPYNTQKALEYLTHKNDKDKYQYDESEIFGIGEIELYKTNTERYIELVRKIRLEIEPTKLIEEYGMLYIANFGNLKRIAYEQAEWEKNRWAKDMYNKYELQQITYDELHNEFLKRGIKI